MQKAIIMAQICLYVAVLVPFFSTDILQLRGIDVGITGWLVALLGPVVCVVLCEACKLITAFQMERHQKSLADHYAAEDKRLAEAAAKYSMNYQAPPKLTKPVAAEMPAPPQFSAAVIAPPAKEVAAAPPAVEKLAAAEPESQERAQPQAATAKQAPVPASKGSNVGCACFIGPAMTTLAVRTGAARD
mmetsp:Transcript_67288/g.194813  ORF Transcript_67288/g.194813 Transcript_67288/m.194813 type:complete len:188 (-) Transcript_67288:71-634(-)